MSDEGTTSEVKIQPRLHDRWSLLALAVGFVDDIASVVSDWTGITSAMAAEHVSQKRIDKKFRRVTNGHSG